MRVAKEWRANRQQYPAKKGAVCQKKLPATLGCDGGWPAFARNFMKRCNKLGGVYVSDVCFWFSRHDDDEKEEESPRKRDSDVFF